MEAAPNIINFAKKQSLEREQSCKIQLCSGLTEDARIQAGRDAWARLRRHETFKDWLLIGEVQALGQAYAAAKAGKPKGYRYNKVRDKWLEDRGLPKLEKSVQSRLSECVRHRDEILPWLDSIEDATRRTRLCHPTTVLVAWRKATQPQPQAAPHQHQDKAERLAELLRGCTLQDLLGALPNDWRPQLEDRLARQEATLSAAKTHDRRATRLFGKVLSAAKGTAAAAEFEQHLVATGTEARDLALYRHRSPHRRVKVVA